MERPNDFELLNSKAELLKAIAHPVRLCIVRGLLAQGECNVSAMQHCLEMSQSTISQHLGKLRDSHIIKGRREGVEVYYQLVHLRRGLKPHGWVYAHKPLWGFWV